MNQKSVAYPPGGILLWMIIYVELATYGIAILALTYYGTQEREIFHTESLMLNRAIATVNTIFLLTSGYLAAQAVRFYKQGQNEKTSKMILLAIIFGFGFLLLKGFEYYQKVQSGVLLDNSTFFIFYWILTGFHFIHVMVGVVILWVQRRAVNKGKALLENLEAGTAFWHMCDIIWLFLFPTLYLLF